jgi:hypothetical protein
MEQTLAKALESIGRQTLKNPQQFSLIIFIGFIGLNSRVWFCRDSFRFWFTLFCTSTLMYFDPLKEKPSAVFLS